MKKTYKDIDSTLLNAIPNPAKTIAGQPNKCFLENVGRTSETIPKAGSIRM